MGLMFVTWLFCKGAPVVGSYSCWDGSLQTPLVKRPCKGWTGRRFAWLK